MNRAVLLLPLLLVLTACDAPPQQPPSASWLQFADRHWPDFFLLIIIGLMYWSGGRRRS